MRIDKFLSNLGILNRKQIKSEIKKNNISVNGNIIKKENEKINFGDLIKFKNEEIIYKENIFIILNKPKLFVSSKVAEASYKSVYELLNNCHYKNILEIVGRLDVDTTGVLLLTNNGKIIHKIIKPKKNIFKKYYVKTLKNISDNDIEDLEKGVIIDNNYLTKEAKVEKISDNEITLSISEGKFHQIKKMLKSIGNKVIELHRKEIGKINIGELELGKWRFLNDDEINYLESL